jgi:hypothetical protein
MMRPHQKTALDGPYYKERKSALGVNGGVPGMIFAPLPQLVLVVFGFASGYGVREWSARRRRAAAREKYYKENPEMRRLLGV